MMTDPSYYPYRDFDYQRIVLERQRFQARYAEDAFLRSRLEAKDIERIEDFTRDQLVSYLTDEILKYDGGAAASDWVVADLALRPRWFPKWAWKRMPTRRVRWELTAEPSWIWPFAQMKLPDDLGRPVEMMVRTTHKREI